MNGVTLKEVAHKLGLKPYQINYALSVGLVPEPALRLANKRVFQQEDLQRLAKHFGLEAKSPKEIEEASQTEGNSQAEPPLDSGTSKQADTHSIELSGPAEVIDELSRKEILTPYEEDLDGDSETQLEPNTKNDDAASQTQGNDHERAI